jgi:hypothetical protein
VRDLLNRRLSNLRSDKYGIYFWSVRFVIYLMWPLRFWKVGRQRDLPYHGGNVSFGPLCIAWYDEAATIPREQL